jgi:hypothetical protein
MGDDDRLRQSAADGVERGDFSHMAYVSSEPPKLVEPSARPRLPPRGRLLTAVSIALAVALVALVIGAAMRTRAGGSVRPQHASVTPTAAPALATSVVEGSPGRGWRVAGPSFGQSIAVAVSEPGTAYACGPVTSGSSSIAFGVSLDHGLTWKTLMTPARGAACDLTVDPTDARDVVLVANSCPTCQTLPPLVFYRTTDGGTHWLPTLLPLEGSGDQHSFEAYQWTWSGSTLYLAPWSVGETGWMHLAVSVGESPFFWADAGGLFAGAPADVTINALLGDQRAIYVVLASFRGCAQSCSRVMRSDDDGTTWTVFSPVDAGRPVSLLPNQSAATESVLFGELELSATANGRLYVSSGDGGASWRALPAFPGQLVAERILQTPNGALYAELTHLSPGNVAPGAAPAGVYRLSPGSITWTFAAEFPGNPSGPLAVTWDASGTPVYLWGSVRPPTRDRPEIGLEYHLP